MDHRRLIVMGRTVLWMVLVGARIAPATQSSGPSEQWIVVTAPALRAVVEPLCDYRAREGLKVTRIDLVESKDLQADAVSSPQSLQGRVQQACRAWKGPSYVLLVGSPAWAGGTVDPQCLLPALPGTIARMTGEPTDNGYACPNEKLMPTVAVGRFPARTTDEARMMVDKTLAWERDRRRPGEWKRRITVLAGAPSFNAALDPLVEMMVMCHLGRLPAVWSGRVIYWNPNSAFSLPSDRLLKKAVEYFDEGQSLVVYLGHSNVHGFWFGQRPGTMAGGFGGEEPCFSSQDWTDLKLDRSVGILATFGCHGCRFGGSAGDGYGLCAMRNPHGPVAVIGAYRDCWAAMSLLFSEGLLAQLPDQRRSPRLGQVWLGMKKHLANAWMSPLTFHALDSVDGSPGTPQATQRMEHQEMFMLLGDPAIRFPAMPLDVSLEVRGRALPGGRLTVTAHVPPELTHATGYLTLERLTASPPIGLKPLPPESEVEKRARVLVANHERANQFVLTRIPVQIEGSTFTSQLDVPAEVPWPSLCIRLYLAAGDAEGMAIQVLQVEKASSSQPSSSR